MDYREEALKATQGPSDKPEAKHREDAIFWFTLGAKRAEELLLADPMILDGRTVWENIDNNDPFQENATEVIMSITVWDVNGDGRRILNRAIPRPKPAWVPQRDEKVFGYSKYSGIVHTGVFKAQNTNGTYEIVVGGHLFEVDTIKPFTPENIGKRWEDINA